MTFLALGLPHLKSKMAGVYHSMVFACERHLTKKGYNDKSVKSTKPIWWQIGTNGQLEVHAPNWQMLWETAVMGKVWLGQAEAYKTSGCRQTGRQREATIQWVTEGAGKSIPGQRTQWMGVRNNEAGEQGKLKWTDRQSHAAVEHSVGVVGGETVELLHTCRLAVPVRCRQQVGETGQTRKWSQLDWVWTIDGEWGIDEPMCSVSALIKSCHAEAVSCGCTKLCMGHNADR